MKTTSHDATKLAAAPGERGTAPRKGRTLLACGVVAGPLYLIVGLTQALTRPGFDITRHDLSLLSNGDLGWVQISNFVLSGHAGGLSKMNFRAVIQLAGKTATGITVPEDIVVALGSSKHPAVRVTLAGHTYRSSVARMGGVFMLPVSAEIRAVTGVAAGNEVEVEMELDTEPREVSLPADFAEALAHDHVAKQAFDALSYSQKRWYVLSIEDAKTADTRQRRVHKAMNMLGNAGRV